MRSIPVPDKPGDTVPVDRETLADILTVLRYVSRGRGYLQVSYAYPDAAARKALGALSNAGLNLATEDAPSAWHKRENAQRTTCPSCHFESSEGYRPSHAPDCDAAPTRLCATHGDAMHPITSQGDPSPVETGYWSCPSCQVAFCAAVNGTVVTPRSIP